MYHRVDEPGTARSKEAFYQHLDALRARYPIVVPGQALTARQSICLTFDDAYVDFFTVVYPYLKQHNLKAILAVPTAYIQNATTLALSERLKVPYPKGMEAPLYEQCVPLCTWEELKEMAQSGHVMMASHTHTHPHLGRDKADVAFELLTSKVLLESHLGQKIEHLVYPYGNFNKKVHNLARQHYRYIHRIGGALNWGWDHPEGLLYRIDAEPTWYENPASFDPLWLKAAGRYAWNRVRGK